RSPPRRGGDAPAVEARKATRLRRSGRAVDGGGLENRWAPSGRPEGSNPSSSARTTEYRERAVADRRFRRCSFGRDGREAEGTGLLNRHTGQTVSRVRIPLSPPLGRYEGPLAQLDR